MWKQDYTPVNKVDLSQRMSALQPMFSPDGKPKCKEETLNRTTSHCSLGQPNSLRYCQIPPTFLLLAAISMKTLSTSFIRLSNDLRHDQRIPG